MNLIHCLSVLSCPGLLWGEPREPPAGAAEASMSGSGSGWSPADWESDVNTRVKSLILGMGRRPLMGMALRPPVQDYDDRSPEPYPALTDPPYISTTAAAEAVEASMSGSGSGWSPADWESDVRSREPYPALTDPPDIIMTAAAEAVDVSMLDSGSGWSPGDWETDVRSTAEAVEASMQGSGSGWSPADWETDVRSTAEAVEASMPGSGSGWSPTDWETDVRTTVKSPILGTGGMAPIAGSGWRPPGQESDVSSTGLHSLWYLFSSLSKKLTGVPQYSVVGFVDDVPIIAYTSESSRAEPRAPWMEKITENEPQFWDENTWHFQKVMDKLSDKLEELMEKKNQTVGLHVFQALEGCELRKDGSTANGLERYAYDGSNYSAKMGRAAYIEDFEEIDCTYELKKLLKIGEERLLTKVAPRTMVSQRKANNHTYLIGYAYGFYPREIEVKWTHSGVEIPWDLNEHLPNPDGTYQVRTTMEVQKEDDVWTYEYHVNHSSLPEALIVTYDPPGSSGQGQLVVVVVVASLMVAVLLVLVAVVFWRPIKNFFSSGDREQRSNKAKTPGGESERVEMGTLQNDTLSDTAGPGTRSDVRSSTCKNDKGSDQIALITG